MFHNYKDMALASFSTTLRVDSLKLFLSWINDIVDLWEHTVALAFIF